MGLECTSKYVENTSADVIFCVWGQYIFCGGGGGGGGGGAEN